VRQGIGSRIQSATPRLAKGMVNLWDISLNNDERSRCIHSSSDRNVLPIISPLHGFEIVVAGPKNSQFPSCWNPEHTLTKQRNLIPLTLNSPSLLSIHQVRKAGSVQTKIKQFHGQDIYQSYLWFTLRCNSSSQKVKWIWPYIPLELHIHRISKDSAD